MIALPKWVPRAGFDRIVDISAAWDRRDPDPSKSYGIHGCELRMVLKGPKGAVQFVLFTNWQLPHVTEEQLPRAIKDVGTTKCLLLPMPADLGYHAPSAQYDGQLPQPECPYLDGKPCFYDGSGLQAMKVYEILLTQGSDGVWEFLEQYYDSRFGQEKS